jgi:hypothetical protein
MSPLKLVIGTVGLIVVVVVVVLLVGAGSDGVKRDDDGRISEAGTLSMLDLRKGDCLKRVPTNTTQKVDVVPCERAHDGEVYTVIELPDGDWPGNSAVEGKGERGCPARLRHQFPTAAADRSVKIYYYTPTEDTWDDGDHALPCVAGYKKPRMGALKGKKVS